MSPPPAMDAAALARYLRSRRGEIERALRRALPPAGARPATIHRAMRYCVFNGGKRLRPILLLAAAEACGGGAGRALPLACAVECVHSYSLVHDDLPCMDDDDLRRGKPTCHKVFGEGIAVLAGDALLTLAFELAASAGDAPRHPAAKMVLELARAAGSRALIAGQVADLEAEGRAVSLPELRFIHRSKTAALVAAAVRLGAMSAGAPPGPLGHLTRFGESLGLAFQIVDDLLDVTQTSERLGKSAGKDAAAGKATFPALVGIEKSRAAARRLTARALDALAPFGRRGAALGAIARHLLLRDR